MRSEERGSSRRNGQVWVIELAGEHDLSTVPLLVEWIAEIDDASRVVEIDLRRTEFIDSTVIAQIVRLAADLVQAGRELVVISPAGGFPRRVLDLAGVTTTLRVVDEPPDELRRADRDEATPLA